MATVSCALSSGTAVAVAPSPAFESVTPATGTTLKTTADGVKFGATITPVGAITRVDVIVASAPLNDALQAPESSILERVSAPVYGGNRVDVTLRGDWAQQAGTYYWAMHAFYANGTPADSVNGQGTAPPPTYGQRLVLVDPPLVLSLADARRAALRGKPATTRAACRRERRARVRCTVVRGASRTVVRVTRVAKNRLAVSRA